MTSNERATFSQSAEGERKNRLREINRLQTALAEVTRQRDEAIRERDLAIAHDRQPYPTASAYGKVCELLHETRKQRDELVEAGKFSRIAAASGHYDEAMATFYATLDRIQSTQPKGEWIDIEPGGSNLPEPVAGTHYRVALRSTGNALWMEAYKLEEFFNADGFDISIAYWSIPHIDRRPDIPPYQPKEHSDAN